MSRIKSAGLINQLDEQIKQAASDANEYLAANSQMIANLVIVEVGADPASRVYIKQKIKKAAALGLTAIPIQLATKRYVSSDYPASTTSERIRL